jgi:hypothetical protein
VEINIKDLSGDALQRSDEETHITRGHREAEVAWLDTSTMKSTRGPSQNRMQSHAYRFLSEPKRRATKDRQEKERARQGGRVMYWRSKAMKYFPLKGLASTKIPIIKGCQQTLAVYLSHGELIGALEMNPCHLDPPGSQCGVRAKEARRRERSGASAREPY